jgi:hypothetical protein
MSSNTFEQHLLEVLRLDPAGLSEHELIRKLEAEGQPGFETGCLNDNLSLFQTHFFLFHSLYQLAGRLVVDAVYRLEINPLCIQLVPVTNKDSTSLAEHDPLRDYYLNLGNLARTDETEVNELLSRFWQRYVSNDERRDALEELELQDPVDWSTIKYQHRRLAMQHHPDRGGDNERLQAINAAMDILARASRHSGNKKT